MDFPYTNLQPKKSGKRSQTSCNSPTRRQYTPIDEAAWIVMIEPNTNPRCEIAQHGSPFFLSRIDINQVSTQIITSEIRVRSDRTMSSDRGQAETMIRQSFLERQWSVTDCPICKRRVLTKRAASTEPCGGCLREFSLAGIPKPNRFQTVEDVCKRIGDFYARTDFSRADPQPIVMSGSSSLFASAAGHLFDGSIHHAEIPSKKQVICVQPVIRLQGKDQVGVTPGFSTSFLNVAPLWWQATPQQHVQSIHIWLDCLSSLGLFVSDFTFVLDHQANNWGMERPVHSLMLYAFYRGIELGVINYFYDIESDHSRCALSDLSFGIERIAWAINKTNFFDAVGPLSQVLDGSGESILKCDTVRTLVLLSGSGVTPSNKAHGYRMRGLANRYEQSFSSGELLLLIPYYYAQWNRFLSLPISLQATINTICLEIERNAKYSILRSMQLSPTTSCDFSLPLEGFIRKFYEAHPAARQSLRDFFERRKS